VGDCCAASYRAERDWDLMCVLSQGSRRLCRADGGHAGSLSEGRASAVQCSSGFAQLHLRVAEVYFPRVSFVPFAKRDKWSVAGGRTLLIDIVQRCIGGQRSTRLVMGVASQCPITYWSEDVGWKWRRGCRRGSPTGVPANKRAAWRRWRPRLGVEKEGEGHTQGEG